MAMDMRCRCSTSRARTRSIRLGRGYCELRPEVNSPAATGRSLWKLLLRKLLKEKRKLFKSPVPVQQVPYNAYTYSQNFDQGLRWDEPDDADDLSRSFSVRFAVPSRIFLETEAM